MAFIPHKPNAKQTQQMPIAYRPRPQKVCRRQQQHTQLSKLMFFKMTIPYLNNCFDDLRVVKYDDWFKIDDDIVILCPIDSERVKNNVIIIERTLRSLNINFQMEYNSAYWVCRTDEFFFILRLWWDEDDTLVLEPTCFDGDKRRFKYFYNTQFR